MLPPPLKAEAPIKITITIPCIYGVPFCQSVFSLTLFIFPVPLEARKDLEPGNSVLQIPSSLVKLLRRSSSIIHSFIYLFIYIVHSIYCASVSPCRIMWNCELLSNSPTPRSYRVMFIDGGTILLGFPKSVMIFFKAWSCLQSISIWIPVCPWMDWKSEFRVDMCVKWLLWGEKSLHRNCHLVGKHVHISLVC